MTKPVVHYLHLARCELGRSALVVPLDHPSPRCPSGHWIHTSRVVRIERASGVFETLNTVYRPLSGLPPKVLRSQAEPVPQTRPEPAVTESGEAHTVSGAQRSQHAPWAVRTARCAPTRA